MNASKRIDEILRVSDQAGRPLANAELAEIKILEKEERVDILTNKCETFKSLFYAREALERQPSTVRRDCEIEAIAKQMATLASDPGVAKFASENGPGIAGRPGRVDFGSPHYGPTGTGSTSAATWLDRDGKAVRVLSPQEKVADLPHTGNGAHAGERLSLGRAIVGLATSDWRHAKAEQLSLNEGANSAGGFLVSDELSRTVIDLARAKSVVIAAGAKTLPMESDRLVLATVTADPQMETKQENQPFSEVEPVFGQIALTSRTIGCLIPLSRELAADAPNMASIVEDTMAKALAAEIDRQVLIGTGSSEMTGLLNAAGVGETGSVGAIAWEDLLTALAAVESNNETPNAWIVHPTVKNDLGALTTGDGTNAAKGWLPPPPDIAALSRHVTSNIGTANLFLGDFTQLAIGLRMQPTIEITNTGGGSFEKFQILLRIVWRGDCAVMRPGAFHRLVGITT